MANKVTLKQIAQEVGLSPSSVSLVLNNRPCRISEENRKLIKEVASLIKGGGGGQPHFATAGGRNPEGLQAAIDHIVSLI